MKHFIPIILFFTLIACSSSESNASNPKSSTNSTETSNLNQTIAQKTPEPTAPTLNQAIEQSRTETSEAPEINQTTEQTRTEAPKTSNTRSEHEVITIEGSFQSKQGVMHKISTKCYRGGLIKTSDGKSIPVCFEKIKADEVSCKQIAVVGTYVNIKGMKFLEADSYQCLD